MHVRIIIILHIINQVCDLLSRILKLNVSHMLYMCIHKERKCEYTSYNATLAEKVIETITSYCVVLLSVRKSSVVLTCIPVTV